MAGHYQQAAEHYQAALAINPRFYSSQFGIADTYLLMGEELRARQTYETAFRKFPAIPTLNYVRWKTNQATTYVRDGDFRAARRAFQLIADGAHARDMGQVEADIYRQMAIFEPHPEQVLALLDKAENTLDQRAHASPTAIQQESAQILRARVEVALKSGDEQTADSALARLAALTAGSDDKMIDSSYHGAAGARLFSERKYKEAIQHLQEDADNPWSLKLLVVAYQRTGDPSAAKHAEETLANYNNPTIDQALVVPAFRKSVATASANSNLKDASLKH